MRDLYFEAQGRYRGRGYTASAVGYGIHTQAETLEELRRQILDAVSCYFGDSEEMPTLVHLRVIHEEVLSR